MCLQQRCLPLCLPAKVLGYAKRRCAATGAKNMLFAFSAARLSFLLLAALSLFCLVVSAFAEAPREIQTLRVAAYDVPPYGYVDSDGSISGVSVDLWRRMAIEC
jgi:ABC-type amino acid transport substrate-binding protein